MNMSTQVAPKVDFSNTQIAFASKSNFRLKKSYWLFKSMNSARMVGFLTEAARISLKLRLPVKGIIKATVFEQFVGGESIADCEQTIKHLKDYKVGTILDYSVEGKTTDAEFDDGVRETIATIKKAEGNPAMPFSVFKVSGIAPFSILEKVSAKAELNPQETKTWNQVVKRVEKICAAASQSNQCLFIDAEESWIQDAIDQLAENMMAKYNTEKAIVYNTAQMYRWDRLDYLKAAHQRALAGNYFLGMKLVRGAYMEKERERAAKMNYPSPIQPNKAASDRDFDLALRYCVENIKSIAFCCGSHNEASNLLLSQLLDEFNIPHQHPHVFFSQLYGMSDHLSFNLSNAGFNVAKYVPYGPVHSVMPYLIRRAAENTSMAGQMSRELLLIVKEIKRRKHA